MAERQDDVTAAADDKRQQNIEAVSRKDACRKRAGEDEGLRDQHAYDKADNPADDDIVVDYVLRSICQQLFVV